MRTALTLAVLCCAACGEVATQEAPFVLHSAEEEARWTIDINRVVDGVYRPYFPRCNDSVRIGHTVEFRNFNPDIPADITAIAGPDGADPLYSPNLMKPYNYVGRDAPDNDICELRSADGCAQRPHYSFWRYTFEVPGVYDFIDSQSGEPGRKIVDPYYGTVTFVGIDPSSPFGTVCVRDENGDGCDAVCCSADGDCESGQRCFRSEVDAVGRCLSPSG